MKIQTEALLVDLTNRTKQLIEKAELLKGKSEEALNDKQDLTSWSVLECLQHLNLYGRFYLPEIKKRMTENKGEGEPVFKSGLLGNYFANSMLPKDPSTGSGLKKMKTFKNMDPINSKLDKRAIDEFLDQQKELLRLLGEARKISLNKTKTSITLSKLIKLKLGDTFRFVIYHNERHMVQAQRIEN